MSTNRIRGSDNYAATKHSLFPACPRVGPTDFSLEHKRLVYTPEIIKAVVARRFWRSMTWGAIAKELSLTREQVTAAYGKGKDRLVKEELAHAVPELEFEDADKPIKIPQRTVSYRTWLKPPVDPHVSGIPAISPEPEQQALESSRTPVRADRLGLLVVEIPVFCESMFLDETIKDFELSEDGSARAWFVTYSLAKKFREAWRLPAPILTPCHDAPLAKPQKNELELALFAARQLDSFTKLVELIPECELSGDAVFQFGPISWVPRPYFFRVFPEGLVQKLNVAFASTAWVPRRAAYREEIVVPLDFETLLAGFDRAFEQVFDKTLFEIFLFRHAGQEDTTFEQFKAALLQPVLKVV